MLERQFVNFNGVKPTDHGYVVEFTIEIHSGTFSSSNVRLEIAVGNVEITDAQSPLDSARKVALRKLAQIFETLRIAADGMLSKESGMEDLI